MGWWRHRNVHLWCDITMATKRKQQDAERKGMKEDDFCFHMYASFYCFVRYNIHYSRLRQSQVR